MPPAADAFWRRPPPAPPLVFAHRGAPTLAPENTHSSFVAALAAGAEVLETDVRTTADGVLVCLHDATLARTAALSKPVANLSLAEVQAAGNSLPGSDTCVPTLAAVLAAFPHTPFNIDLKAVDLAGVAQVFALLRARPTPAGRVILTSASAATQAHIAANNQDGLVQQGLGTADVRTLLLAAWLPGCFRRRAAALRGRACQMPAFFRWGPLKLPLLFGPLPAALRRLGCPLHVWWHDSHMVDTAAQLAYCRRRGVDGVFTNCIQDPPFARPARPRQAATPVATS